MTEKTPTQLPANKKCCLLIFATAIGCLVLAAIPARNPRLSLSIIPKMFGISLCPATCYAFASGLAIFSSLFFRTVGCHALAVPPARNLVTASYLFIVPNNSGISRSASTANVTIPHPETGLVLAAIPASKSTIYKNSS